jgi:anti-anti-sigma factor
MPSTERSQGLGCASYAQGPGFARVVLSGELDIASAPHFLDELVDAAAGSAVVILDLRELTFMDSTGLQAILTAHARLAQADCRLALIRGRPSGTADLRNHGHRRSAGLHQRPRGRRPRGSPVNLTAPGALPCSASRAQPPWRGSGPRR